MEHTVLVTGFGPFHEHKTNASWQSVKLLPKYSNKNINIIVEEIPVVYECVDNIVPTLWNKHNPKLVVHVGVSSVATGITIERVAHRSGYARTDCNGKSQLAGSCTYGSEECLRTKIDVDKLCRHLSTISKLKFCTSSNAGRYLCEYIYYKSLSIDPDRVLFIHVPPLQRPYSSEELAAGIFQIISYVLKSCLD